MSYILDALKKSEEERHQGQVPNLGSNSTLIHSSRSKAVVWPWVIGILLAINIFVVAYWFLTNKPTHGDVKSEYVEEQVDQAFKPINYPDSSSHPQMTGRPLSLREQVQTESSEVSTGLAKQVVQSNDQSAVSIQSSNSADAAENKQPASAASEKRVEPKRIALDSTVLDNTIPTSVVSENRHASIEESAIADVQLKEEAPLLITPKGKSRPYTGPGYQPLAQNDGGQLIKPQTEINASKQKNVEEISEIESTDIMHITDKPHSFQLQIPDMAFNSHIFTNEPSSRRVMINNIYLREGQSFSGMKVEQITEEGIILSLEGESFKIGVLRDWYSPR
ncbi:general secretion pathway protein GspB [Alkalimarinus coralli]|uniref:general secretion pathway protein GspB n=1 Tax=Alkalimarinus coralli TaxID=2935863 RepID=UPI00202AF8CB|nr:general secretion pathway protein GspB [Alkalimarinus coralli]